VLHHHHHFPSHFFLIVATVSRRIASKLVGLRLLANILLKKEKNKEAAFHASV